jgi:multidrug efflux system membrane fusion protein
VQPGPAEGNLTAIETGLAAGERVITDGVDRIREGSKVEVTQPGTRGPRGAPGKGPGDAKGEAKGDDAKREEFKKRLESMTPEQREELKKRRQAREGKAAQ